MQVIPSVEPRQAQGRTRQLLDAVEKTFGTIPNAVKVMANSPAVLDSFLALSTAMAGAKIGGKLHHQIKMAASEANSGEYCNALLTHLGKKSGISLDELLDGRKASSGDPAADAALKFARSVLETRGNVGDGEVEALRRAGFGDGEIVEVVTSVVVGCFTNFLNNVARTTLDIPRAEPLADCSPDTCCGSS
jgi:alkylhydroperoxidase family enzyme